MKLQRVGTSSRRQTFEPVAIMHPIIDSQPHTENHSGDVNRPSCRKDKVAYCQADDLSLSSEPFCDDVGSANVSLIRLLPST